jgi:threonine synthase
VAAPETVASAIRIGDPASWAGALAARDESGGLVHAVSDRAILDAQRLLSAKEGVFVEPASAAAVAGLLQCHRRGLLDPGLLVVCTVTGNGLKDTETALREISIDTETVPADVRAAAAVLGLQPA